MDMGASGGQFATRFIATRECDAHPAYKQALIDAKPEDITIIQSPVGLPGRALRSPLIQRRGPVGVGKAEALVDGKVVTEAELTFAVAEKK